MRTPSRASISTRRRGIVQLRGSATAAWSRGAATRKAASLFTGGGPGAILVFSAATPPAAKSQRHWRTVSSRTPNASAMSGLVQPASVKSTARARSASRDHANWLAPRDRRVDHRSPQPQTSPPCHAPPSKSTAAANRKRPIRWLTERNLLRSQARFQTIFGVPCIAKRQVGFLLPK